MISDLLADAGIAGVAIGWGFLSIESMVLYPFRTPMDVGDNVRRIYQWNHRWWVPVLELRDFDGTLRCSESWPSTTEQHEKT